MPRNQENFIVITISYLAKILSPFPPWDFHPRAVCMLSRDCPSLSLNPSDKVRTALPAPTPAPLCTELLPVALLCSLTLLRQPSCRTSHPSAPATPSACSTIPCQTPTWHPLVSLGNVISRRLSWQSYLSVIHTMSLCFSKPVLFFCVSLNTIYDFKVFVYLPSVLPSSECKLHESNLFNILFLQQCFAQHGCSKNIRWFKEQSIT